MIYLIIFILVVFGSIRLVSFGIWHIRDKNICGGAALVLLGILSAVSSLINLLS